jgi:hypothetical protein
LATLLILATDTQDAKHLIDIVTVEQEMVLSSKAIPISLVAVPPVNNREIQQLPELGEFRIKSFFYEN